MNAYAIGVFSLYISVIGTVTIACFCGDADGHGFLDLVLRVISRTIPQFVLKIVRVLPGGNWAISIGYRVFDYVVNQRNPILQSIYLALVLGGYGIFLYDCLDYLYDPNFFHPIHQITSHLAVLCTLLTFVKASVASPGVITKDTVDKYSSHEYDGFLYVKQDCKTCLVRKLPRSKHCSLCGHCVARFDHHCPWINVCVGEDNLRFFILFLFSTMSLLLYASWALAVILYSQITRMGLLTREFFDKRSQKYIRPTYVQIVQLMAFREPRIIFLLILALIMGIVLYFFLAYHLYLIARGTTTNETAKWSTVGYVYKHMKQLTAEEEAMFARREKEGKSTNRPLKKDLCNPDKAPALYKRYAVEFPEERPKNAYNYGIVENFRRVFFPHRYQKTAPPAVQRRRAKAASNKKKHK